MSEEEQDEPQKPRMRLKPTKPMVDPAARSTPPKMVLPPSETMQKPLEPEKPASEEKDVVQPPPIQPKPLSPPKLPPPRAMKTLPRKEDVEAPEKEPEAVVEKKKKRRTAPEFTKELSDKSAATVRKEEEQLTARDILVGGVAGLTRIADDLVRGSRPLGRMVYVCLALLGLGLLMDDPGLFVPHDLGIHSVMNSSAASIWLTILAKALFAGPLFCAVVGGLVFVLVRCGGGLTDFGMACKLVAVAFLPLSILRVGLLLYLSNMYGEAFWRGYLPEGFDRIWTMISLALLAWAFVQIYMATRATCGVQPVRGLIFTAGVPIALAAVAAYGPHYRSFEVQVPISEVIGRAEKMLSQGGYDGAYEEFDAALRRVPFSDWELRARLLLSKAEAAHLQKKYRLAGEQYLRVVRLLPKEEVSQHVARAAILLIGGETARSEGSLQYGYGLNAQDPMLLRYLARLHTGVWGGSEQVDWKKGERYARQAWRVEPSAAHGALLVDALFQQKKYEDVYELMTGLGWERAVSGKALYQGGIAAYHLGHHDTAKVLFEVCVQKEAGYAKDPIVDRMIGHWTWDDNAGRAAWPFP